MNHNTMSSMGNAYQIDIKYYPNEYIMKDFKCVQCIIRTHFPSIQNLYINYDFV